MEETNTTYKVSETKGLERLTTKRITFIGKALLLPFYQTTITKQQNNKTKTIRSFCCVKTQEIPVVPFQVVFSSLYQQQC